MTRIAVVEAMRRNGLRVKPGGTPVNAAILDVARRIGRHELRPGPHVLVDKFVK
ncbi:hypothetical protein GCM10009557_27690 [Virgisporangium ochraceum]|uniref:Uncharacterized protein n=1 Tax=Virgisporangium ochraceum TaxID=65505 RepID=A0A8J4EEZ6_9ACTN|nr:hypothetical protein [Virgisporangium ochraceum]GIJ73135.1 hypothetical protein Voc01_080520 [Virgisporangium ochraceum]